MGTSTWTKHDGLAWKRQTLCLFVVVIHVEITWIHALGAGSRDPEALFETLVGHGFDLGIRREIVIDLKDGLVLLGSLCLGRSFLLIGPALGADGLWFSEVVELRVARK